MTDPPQPMEKTRTPSKSRQLKELLNYLKPIPLDKPLGPHYKLSLAAHLLGKSVKWLKQKIREGKLDGYMLDHDIVVSLESINRYLEICRITGAALEPDGDDDEDSSGD